MFPLLLVLASLSSAEEAAEEEVRARRRGAVLRRRGARRVGRAGDDGGELSEPKARMRPWGVRGGAGGGDGEGTGTLVVGMPAGPPAKVGGDTPLVVGMGEFPTPIPNTLANSPVLSYSAIKS